MIIARQEQNRIQNTDIMTRSIEYYVLWYRILGVAIFYFWRVAINTRLTRQKMLDELNAVK